MKILDASGTGKDAKDNFEDAEHSKAANKLLKEYYIGELIADEDEI